MKKLAIIFIAVCLVLCMIPSVGMLFFPTTQTTENRPMAAPAKLVMEDGSFNKAFSKDFESYFNEHMALRNPLVYADAVIQTTLFRESNVSGVIDGTNGWLYYASTLSDYLGRDLLSQRQLYNLAHNFSVIQEYLDLREIDFVLTIPPNKNTLYGENMPYYASYTVNPDHSAKLLAPYLQQQNIRYVDLFQLFEEQDEVLYLLRDSHWNNKGACLAYNAVMNALEWPHRDYASTPPLITADGSGDLNRMLYSFYGDPELNYSYFDTPDFEYTNGASSVQDGWIITENTSGKGSLLMFRDSFADTLIPFMSREFKTAYYSKGQPNALEAFVESYQPDCVVIEKVERNITDYLDNPPILTPPEGVLPANITIAKTATTVSAEPCMNDVNYYTIRGTLDPQRMQENSEVLVSADGTLYRAYQTGEDEYLLYLKKAAFTASSIPVQVYIVNGDTCVQALHTALDLPQ